MTSSRPPIAHIDNSHRGGWCYGARNWPTAAEGCYGVKNQPAAAEGSQPPSENFPQRLNLSSACNMRIRTEQTQPATEEETKKANMRLPNVCAVQYIQCLHSLSDIFFAFLRIFFKNPLTLLRLSAIL